MLDLVFIIVTCNGIGENPFTEHSLSNYLPEGTLLVIKSNVYINRIVNFVNVNIQRV
jgi:hypothetical protein